MKHGGTGKKAAKSLILQFLLILFCLAALPLPSFAEKVCPKCGVRYSDEYNNCIKDGTQLPGKKAVKQSPLPDDFVAKLQTFF